MEEDVPSPNPYDEEVHSLMRGRSPTKRTKSSLRKKNVEDDLDRYNRLVHAEYIDISSRGLVIILGIVICVALVFGSFVAEMHSSVNKEDTPKIELPQVQNVRLVALPLTPSLHSDVQINSRLSILNLPLSPDFLKTSRVRFAIAMREPWRRAASALSSGRGGMSATKECRRRSGSNTNATMRALEYRDCCSACVARILLGRRCLGPVLNQMELTESLHRLESFDFVADAERWHSALFVFAAKFDFRLVPNIAQIAPYDRLDQATDSWIADLYRSLPFEDDKLYRIAQSRLAADLDAITSTLIQSRQIFIPNNDDIHTSSLDNNPLSEVPPSSDTTDILLTRQSFSEYPGLLPILGGTFTPAPFISAQDASQLKSSPIPVLSPTPIVTPSTPVIPEKQSDHYEQTNSISSLSSSADDSSPEIVQDATTDSSSSQQVQADDDDYTNNAPV
eukprot:CAMPEP_0197316294 /NCGR_PEP_ID=MMETSP0891-20130614/42114_1 /TAXON_ID=44058 ORGANISM="Aureoumbra lagunensis, Strain CCMP1510" /NCGR_SAMPLE_ID=MMETSP0891 /ASSEMBLY_ACC=CAM_ASM_000534 /LENGTH=448 /DNA_ID=CAMNT_0042805693 /DNA_START=81 /DNA_END=1427 /DNA_ORIENTATION=+